MIFSNGDNKKHDYFSDAKSWADDVYGSAIQSKNRYKTAFLSSMTLNVATALAVVMLAGMQTLETQAILLGTQVS